MKRLILTLMAVGFGVGLCNRCQAQNLAKRVELSAFGGAVVFANRLSEASSDVSPQFDFATSIEDNYLFGAAVGYHFNQHLQAEGTFGWVPTNLIFLTRLKLLATASPWLGSRSSQNADLLVYYGSLNFNLPVGRSRFIPYVSVGGGAMTYKFEGSQSETALLGQLGAGLRIRLSDAIAIRLQLSNYFSSPSFSLVKTVVFTVTNELGQTEVIEATILEATKFQRDGALQIGISIFP